MQQTTHNNKSPRLTALQLALAAAGLLGAGVAIAQGTAAQTSVGQVQDVVVTTGVRGEARTVADSPAPIDVISGEQLIHTGRAELGEALARLLPSFNFGTNQAGVNSVVRPVSNRGLGPAYTLVLVNGKRRHNSALLTNGGGDTSGVNAIDLDTIPLSIIDHIEVLKDSAAAQYGSDAVAGVVNVILKTGNHGGQLGVSYGELKEVDGNPGNAKIEGNAGFRLGDDGFINIGVAARKRGQSWKNFPSTNLVAYSPASNPKNATWNRDGAHNGDPGIEAYDVGFNLEKPLDKDTTLYAFGTAGTRNTVAGNNFRRPNGLATLAQVYPDGYFAINNMSAFDFQLNAGARGRTAGWNWDISTGYGKNRARQYSNLTLNPSLGPTSPTSFDNLATYQFEQWTTNEDFTRAFDVGLKKPLQWSWGLEQRFERFSTYAGDRLGYINGGYIFQPGDQEGNPNVGRPAAVGAQAGVALSPDDATRVKRTVLAIYNDIGFYPVERWFVGAAVRAEHYNDSAGNTASGKLNTRYDFSPVVAIRGTAGSGFRAPSLTQIGYSQTDNRTNINPVTGEVAPSLSKLLRNDSDLARRFGARDLDPENSVNFGLGLVLKPADNINITLDGYQVKVKDRIVRTGYMFGPAFAPTLRAAGLTGTEWVQYFANAIDTRTRGADLVTDLTSDYGSYGLVRWGAAVNWNRTKVQRINATPSEISALGANTGGSSVWFGYSAGGGIGDLSATPRTKIILSARWFAGDWEVNAQTTRFDSYTWQTTANRAQDYHFGAKWLTDFDVSYAVSKSIKLVLGAANVFDTKPDRNGPGDANSGSSGFTYGPSPFAPSGAYYYGKVAYDF